MKSRQTSQLLSNGLWTLSVLTALLLLIATLTLVIQSDESRQPEVRAYLDSPQAVVVLHKQPEDQAGISTLLDSGTWVTVLEYNPYEHPHWAYVRQGVKTGWIQLEYLSEKAP